MFEMAAVTLARNGVVPGVSCAVSSPTFTPSGNRESCVRVSLGRTGAAALPCTTGRRTADQLSSRWEARAALKELSVDNDAVVLVRWLPFSQLLYWGMQGSCVLILPKPGATCGINL